ncbi:DUF4349 domain-containing protein [Geobacter sp. FeAm09]|uniref:DUF4349 domain-containing protein n=1 Tax=Geobacter sp. FeAm09 TaxID=2597769 RepID=UPI0011EE6C3F|nr:DUF4349 domain-containing protein [Geobacter sp. FeAm09]QEM67548.1 DUF4349 domain-containing protein [Geobacter sp. FeAm09]
MNCRQHAVHRVVIVAMLLTAVCCLASCKKKEEAAPASAPVIAGSPAPKGETAPQERKRKIILNHSVNVEVRDCKAALDALTKLTEANGGYVFKSSRNSHDGGSRWGSAGIRVPVGKVGGVLAGIRGLGKVDNESSTAEDITEGYIDLEARLKITKLSEARLSELYRKAGKLSDVLEVEKELTRVRGDIEAFEAKKRNWDQLTELVTIEVSLSESSSGMPSGNRIMYPIRTAVGGAVTAFVDSLHALIVFLGAIIPWAAIFGPLAYFTVRRLLKKLSGKWLESQDGGVGEDHLP